MPTFESSSLWSLSAFEALRRTAASPAFAGMQRATLLPTTLQAELRLIDRRREGSDALEAIAACVRLREPALIYLRYEDRVWPVTLFPQDMLYHSPRNLLMGGRRGLRNLKLIDIEPPALRPPGHAMHERIASAQTYHALAPALWKLALQGPRATLLTEIGGTAAYRALRHLNEQDIEIPGALIPAAERLRRETAPLRKIATWPGMSVERASRMLNALYLSSNLIVSRTHHTARAGFLEWLIGRGPR
jgi:hypothetical protein